MEEEEDFWDVTITFVRVKKDDEIIAEGRIHYQIFSNEWDEEMEVYDRQGHDDALIINGQRHQSCDIENDGYLIEWGDEREFGTYESLDDADYDFEKLIEGEIHG